MKALDLLRELRTLGYRSLSPFERFLGPKNLPPLWLRRHVGDPSKFDSAARDSAAWIDRFQLLSARDRVLDIGCGCGAMVPQFASRLEAKGSYVGFDVHEPSIRWCRKAYAEDPRFRFELASIDSPYSRRPNSTQNAASYRFPLEDQSVDFVLAKSVFTHLLEKETQQYLNEIARVLSPGGSALVSFFLFDEALLEDDGIPAFTHHLDPRIRWRLAGHPHAAVAYGRTFVFEQVAATGLAAQHVVEGFWPGLHPEIRAQDLLILTR